MSLKTVILEGAIADFTGFSECVLDVQSPLEALHALVYQIEGLGAFIESASAVYRVVVDEADRGIEELKYGFRETLRVIPVPAGSDGIGKFIGGALLIGAAFAFPGGIFGLSALGIGAIGAGMILQGVMGLLSPTPEPGGEDDTSGNDSHLFDKSSRPTKEGQALPILIGTFRFEPKIVFSSSITAYRVELEDDDD